MSEFPKYIVLDKAVGETPLSCAEAYRAEHSELAGVPMAYAGRLDPMASGKLLILLGDECKNQTNYHGLDKEYEFSVLLGIQSDSQDVMGRLEVWEPVSPENERDAVGGFGWGTAEASESGLLASKLEAVCKDLTGSIELPYPIFSSKTVQGKPLHTWTMEGRLNEISIPTKESEIYELEFTKLETISKEEMVKEALAKVNSVPPVTELRKALGNDFRREDVRKDWNTILQDDSLPDSYQIAHLRCIASSGSYMRTLASVIANRLGTSGLAWHIHRTAIGQIDPKSMEWKISF
jgi:tRNA pseudouridine55 synthase